MSEKNKVPGDLHTNYKRTLEASFVIALLIVCSLFFAFQKNESTFELPFTKIHDIKIKVVPLIKQPPPKPPKPKTPTTFIPDDDAPDLEPEIPDFFEFDPNDELPPPPPEEDIEHIFETWQTSKKPELKFKAIPVYPELARKAGIEGRVTILVIVSKTGQVIDAKILKGHDMLENAALDAARLCTFSPAKQRDKFVKVKMTIPFDFRLN